MSAAGVTQPKETFLIDTGGQLLRSWPRHLVVTFDVRIAPEPAWIEAFHAVIVRATADGVLEAELLSRLDHLAREHGCTVERPWTPGDQHEGDAVYFHLSRPS